MRKAWERWPSKGGREGKNQVRWGGSGSIIKELSDTTCEKAVGSTGIFAAHELNCCEFGHVVEEDSLKEGGGVGVGAYGRCG